MSLKAAKKNKKIKGVNMSAFVFGFIIGSIIGDFVFNEGKTCKYVINKIKKGMDSLKSEK
jgi:hypothetical protein